MTVRTAEDMLHYAQASMERERRARFKKECPAAFEMFEAAETRIHRLTENFQRALTAFRPHEVVEAARQLTDAEILGATHEWCIAKEAYRRFLERDLAPLFVQERCSVCGHVKNDAACQKAHP